MADQLLLENGTLSLTTEEGQRVERPESDLVELLRNELLPPLGAAALPDGIKFVEWRNPYLVLVHQLPPHVRRMQWIAPDSPQDFGPGTTYRQVRLSMPYSITFAVYGLQRDRLFLTGSNELYFRNSPLRDRSDSLCYPALLNVSRVDRNRRQGAWICTQHLGLQPEMTWTGQLEALLNHFWNSGSNRSSERHEGASWYSVQAANLPSISTVEAWEAATRDNEAMALHLPWAKAPLNAGQMIDALLQEASPAQPATQPTKIPEPGSSLLSRFVNFIHGA